MPESWAKWNSANGNNILSRTFLLVCCDSFKGNTNVYVWNAFFQEPLCLTIVIIYIVCMYCVCAHNISWANLINSVEGVAFFLLPRNTRWSSICQISSWVPIKANENDCSQLGIILSHCSQFLYMQSCSGSWSLEWKKRWDVQNVSQKLLCNLL